MPTNAARMTPKTPDASPNRQAAPSLGSLVGTLALVATFLLLSPGVRAVRADEPAPPAEPMAEEALPGAVADEMKAFPREVDPKAAAESGDVVLNTRGYNYGPDRPTVRPSLRRKLTAPAAPDASKTD